MAALIAIDFCRVVRYHTEALPDSSVGRAADSGSAGLRFEPLSGSFFPLRPASDVSTFFIAYPILIHELFQFRENQDFGGGIQGRAAIARRIIPNTRSRIRLLNPDRYA